MVREAHDHDQGSSAQDPSLDEWFEEAARDLSASSETIGLLGGREDASGQFGISRTSKMARLREILGIARSYDIFHGLTPRTLRELLEELGPTFVKADQILSMRSEILPESFCRELAKLRTDVEPMDRATMLQTLRDEYEQPIEELFDAIDDVPLGSASVAQVHKARLITGELVAVKVQRPHVREIMAQDISIMRSLARRAARFMADDQFLDLQSVVQELWQSFVEETDFMVEARSLAEFRRNNVGVRYVECPKPYPELCTPHVVVMDYMEGIPIDDLAELRRQGYDPDEIGTKLVDNYTKQMLDDGFFHADPHPGNLYIRDGKIVYLDLGIMGRLSSRDRMALAEMVEAVGLHDSAKLKHGLLLFSVSDVANVNHANLLADLDAIVAIYGDAELSELDMGAFLGSLVSMARKNGIELPGTVTMLARSLVTLEGVADQLLEGTSIVEIIKRHVAATSSGNMVREELDLLSRESLTATHGLLEAASDLPLALKMLTRGQLRMQLDLAGSEDPIRDMARAADRLTMGIIIAGLFIGSSVVYFARIKPVIFGIPVIGFVGYLVALLLGLWLVFQIMHESKHGRR